VLTRERRGQGERQRAVVGGERRADRARAGAAEMAAALPLQGAAAAGQRAHGQAGAQGASAGQQRGLGGAGGGLAGHAAGQQGRAGGHQQGRRAGGVAQALPAAALVARRPAVGAVVEQRAAQQRATGPPPGGSGNVADLPEQPGQAAEGVVEGQRWRLVQHAGGALGRAGRRRGGGAPVQGPRAARLGEVEQRGRAVQACAAVARQRRPAQVGHGG